MKRTKEETYQEFMSDIRSIEKDIELDRAIKSQYIKLAEFYAMVGLDKDELSELLETSGFKDFIDYFNNKEFKQNESQKITSFISTIKGINNAIDKRLKADLQENPE